MMWRVTRFVNRPIGLIQDVSVPLRKPHAAAVAVVRLEQLSAVADVEPFASEAVAVDRRARVEPGDEVAGLIGWIALGEVRVQQRQMCAVVDVRRDRDQVRLRGFGLLFEADDAVVRVELDDAVLADELAYRMLVDGDCAAVLATPEVDVLREA